MNEIQTRLMKFITDPEHLKENFESLDTYLEALRDSALTKESSSDIGDAQAYLAMVLGIFSLMKEQAKLADETKIKFNKIADETNIKINSLTEKVVKLQKEFDEWKSYK